MYETEKVIHESQDLNGKHIEEKEGESKIKYWNKN